MYVSNAGVGSSVETAEIADGAITNAKINASAGIAYSKLLGTDVTSGGGNIFVPLLAYSNIPQGTWTYGTDSSDYFQMKIYNSTAADADAIEFQVWLAKGTYTVVLHGEALSDSGILDIQIDGVEVASFDQYNGGAYGHNKTWSQAAIAIATSGIKTLKVIVDGKHASSSSYTARISSIYLNRTA